MAELAVVNCSQLVTLRGPARPRVGAELRDAGVIANGAMLVRDGRIAAVGALADVERLMGAECEVVDAGGRVVMPGFVDAHTHLVFAGDRAAEFGQRCAGATYAGIAAAGGGIRATVRRTRAATEDGLFAAARRHVDWFIRCGTTTAEAKSGYGLSPDDELKMLRVIRRLNEAGPLRLVPTFLGAHEVPDEYRLRPGEYVHLVVNEMLPRVAAERLAEYCDVFCEQGVFTPEEARQVMQAAQEHGLKLRIHADQLANSGGARLAAELGASTADHLEYTDSAGVAALCGAGVQPVLLPASVYALGARRYPAAREMIEAGLAVVVATDFNPGSSPTPSLPMALSIACTQMNMTPAEAISAATINAAYSLGLGSEIGSLEPGKRADFVLFDCADYREIVYWFGIEQTRSVWIGGNRVYER